MKNKKTKRLGDYVKEYMAKNNLSYRQFGKLIGVSHTQAIYLAEDTYLPKASTINLLAKTLGLTTDEVKKMAYKEIDGEYKAYLTEDEKKKRGII